jgi:hypothetical protein
MSLEVETEPLDFCSWMVKSLLRETRSDTTCCIIGSDTPKRGGVNWVYHFFYSYYLLVTDRFSHRF